MSRKKKITGINKQEMIAEIYFIIFILKILNIILNV